MKKRSILLMCLIVFCVQTIFAQVLIQGTVRSSSSEFLPGVNVSVKGTNKGVVTDVKGQFMINARTDEVLVFSFIGYEKSEISLNGRNKVDVVLKNTIEQIDEVVVTALGIKREEKALGYSTQNIRTEQISNAMSTQWARSLAGKVAGLNIVSPGGPIGSLRITLRGDVSLNMNGSGGVSRYNFNDNAGNGTWDTYYRWLNNIKEMETLAIDFNDPNYQAVALTLRSLVMQLLADSFGDVPMSEASRGAEGLLQPKFDTQQEIYTQLLADLEKANALFNTITGLRYNTEGEFLFGTNDALVSGQSVGIAIPISGVFPQEAPMTRPQDFSSYRGVASFFIDNLNTWNDPRRDVFCTKAAGVFIGWPSGYSVAPTVPVTPPNMNQNLAKAPLKMVILPYAEIEFIRAEAAFYGWNTAGKSANDST